MATMLFGAEIASAERVERSVRVGDRERTYIVHLPGRPEQRATWPVLIAFHPGLANGRYMERTTALHRGRLGRQYVVVYPDGYRRTWNAGDCCGKARQQNIDDIAFFEAIMADVATLVPTEPKAFLTGFSNGAILSYHLACKRPEKVAAIAPYASAYPKSSCRVGKVPVFHVHGTEDISAPVEGGRTQVRSFDQTRVQSSASATVARFGARNGCNANATSDWYSEQLKTTCRQHKSCSGHETTLCVVERLGHTWPGAKAENNALGRKFGPARTDIDGSGAILTFFQRHRAN